MITFFSVAALQCAKDDGMTLKQANDILVATINETYLTMKDKV